MIVKDCSTSWSSDNDDDATTKSLDKIDGDASSDVHDDPTPCTLDGDDGSCSGYESNVSSSSPLHHIALCHKVTPSYQMIMWLIMLIHMMSL